MPIPARLAAIACLLLTVTAAMGQVVLELGEDARSLLVDRVLAAESLARGGRSLIVTDPVEASIVRGTWTAPDEGDIIAVADGRTATWSVLQAGDDGVLTGPAAAGYAHVVIRSPARRIMMLHARGHRHVFVNGERRGGDVYNLGITALPIELREGDNELLFRGGRGQLRIELREPEASLFWMDSDVTKPDYLMTNEMRSLLIAAPLVNATTRQLLGVKSEWAGLWTATSEVTGNGAIAPLGVRKLPVYAASDQKPDGEEASIWIRANSASGNAATTLTLRVRTLHDKHTRTFVSTIDGSVQYYAVTPPPEGERADSLILTLHGASVEARNQANAYDHRDWAVIVAPTNRRPFGFDWEDWGRIDAMEVLDHAAASFGLTGSPKTYLTGHSMGGHGTWQLGAHFAPRFAAIGPSAGWRDFWSYGGAGDFDESDPIGRILNTANNASRTLLLEENYKDLGVYILHGDADDNVPVDQARFMRERLKDHPDLAYHEQPGAGHWWGNQCVDWPPMMEFFEDRSIDMAPATETFTTINPAISSEARLFTIHRQAKAMMPTKVEVTRLKAEHGLNVSTDNALAFSLSLEIYQDIERDKPYTVTIDGDKLTVVVPAPADPGPMRFERKSVADPWQEVGSFDLALKGAHRAGPFKHAFQNNMAFVYATGGTEEENAWALAKARYDADAWQYRANGAVDVLPDTAFDPDAAVNAGRNVILYGCADSHTLWGRLLGEAHVRIGRGSARVGDRTLERDDVAAFFVYPRAGTEGALVGVVAGTGAAGRRLADEPRYFISGVGYPDWLLLTPEVLETGLDGVAGAGFFGPDWSVDPAQSGWRGAP